MVMTRDATAMHLLGAGAMLTATPAHAHLVETGFGAFYDGIAHVALTPADLLVVLALALLAGQRGTSAARWTLFALPVAWLVGGAVGTSLPSDATIPALTTLTFALAGALVALAVKLHPAGVAGFAAAAGLLHGYLNGAALASDGASTLALAGVGTAVLCLVAILSAQVTTLRTGWTRIAVRAAGSWITAVGILMLGLLARPML
jgi:hydrogenase/urease accessory protein HupE